MDGRSLGWSLGVVCCIMQHGLTRFSGLGAMTLFSGFDRQDILGETTGVRPAAHIGGNQVHLSLHADRRKYCGRRVLVLCLCFL